MPPNSRLLGQKYRVPLCYKYFDLDYFHVRVLKSMFCFGKNFKTIGDFNARSSQKFLRHGIRSFPPPCGLCVFLRLSTPLIKPPSKTTCVYPSRSCIIILVPSSFFPSAHCHGFSPSFRSFGRRKEQLAVNQADGGRSTTLLQIRSLPPPPPSLHLRIRRWQLVRELTTVKGMSYQVLLPRQ